MKFIVPLIALGSLLVLSGCGRPQPEGSLFHPVCMPDGSVVFWQQPDANGTYGKPVASHANCAWNKPKEAAH
jgi:hypothetical protein